MGKHVVYLRSRDEKALEADGLKPADWVREVVRKALDNREQPLFPDPPPRTIKE